MKQVIPEIADGSAVESHQMQKPVEAGVQHTTPGQTQPAPGEQGNSPAEREARRSSRVSIAIPIVVYGKGPDGKIFQEKTSTLVVNAHGAMFLLESAVNRQQQLMLNNPKRRCEIACRVVYSKKTSTGQFEIGAEFDAAAPAFWGIRFPPPDWKNADRKRPVAQDKSQATSLTASQHKPPKHN